jgi:hypothetical protein
LTGQSVRLPGEPIFHAKTHRKTSVNWEENIGFSLSASMRISYANTEPILIAFIAQNTKYLLILVPIEWGKLIGTKIFKPDASGKVSPLGS